MSVHHTSEPRAFLRLEVAVIGAMVSVMVAGTGCAVVHHWTSPPVVAAPPLSGDFLIAEEVIPILPGWDLRTGRKVVLHARLPYDGADMSSAELTIAK